MFLIQAYNQNSRYLSKMFKQPPVVSLSIFWAYNYKNKYIKRIIFIPSYMQIWKTVGFHLIISHTYYITDISIRIERWSSRPMKYRCSANIFFNDQRRMLLIKKSVIHDASSYLSIKLIPSKKYRYFLIW